MTVFTIGADKFETLRAAQTAAKSMNESTPETEIAIKTDDKVSEIWVGPVTYRPAGEGAFVAYSDADIDSIGAVRRAGKVYTAGNRGVDVGTFLNLFEAAHGLHNHANSAAYKAA